LTNIDEQFDASVDKVNTIIQRRESDVIIKPEIPEVEITKEKTETADEVKKLDVAIEKEVPKELPIPKFSQPNPIKSKKKSGFMQKFRSYGGGARPQLDNNIKNRIL